MNHKEIVNSLPVTPGVYLMKNGAGSIIYVGKAKSLKNRVGQYFQSSKQHQSKILRMVNEIKSIDYIKTDTELEALLLECKLIKEIKPFYNKLMKDTRRYLYIAISMSDEYPTPEISSMASEAGFRYFGPYTNSSSVEKAVEAIKSSFGLRQCSKLQASKAGCLKHQLGYCVGPCRAEASRDEYMLQLSRAIAFLEGRDLRIINKLEKDMETAAEKLQFDRAAKYRDDVFALGHLVNKQKAISFAEKNRSIIAAEGINEATVKLLLISSAELLFEKKIDVDNANRDQLIAELKQHIRECFFETPLSEANIDKDNIDQAQIIFSYLKGHKGCCYELVYQSWKKPEGDLKMCNALNRLIDKIYGR